MSRKNWIMMVVLALVLSLMVGSGAAAPRSEPQETVTLNLPLLLDEGARRGMQATNIARGHQTYFGLNAGSDFRADDFVLLNITITGGAAEAHGRVQLGGTAFALRDLTGSSEPHGSSVAIKLMGIAQTRGNEHESAVFVLYEPAMPQASFVSVTVGAMDAEKGTAIAVFGKRPTLELPIGRPVNRSGSDSGSGEVVAMGDEYLHRTSAYYSTVGWSDCACSEPGSYSSTGGPVVSFDIYTRDPSTNGNGTGSVQVRMYSFSDQVSTYAGNTWGPEGAVFSVHSAWIRFYEKDGSGTININNWSPAEPDLADAKSQWSFLSSVPKIGKILTVFANYWLAASSPVDVVSSRASNGRTNKMTIEVRDLNWDADYPGTNPALTYEQTDGGLTAWFDYLEYGSGTERLQADVRARYFGWTDDLGYIFLWTRWAGSYWDANFLT